uniref:Integrase catalytic domain-containing protein n=1 Tax=Haemonchus contortus TaxID=6289 RepID=A0A7I4Z4J9_HAECO
MLKKKTIIPSDWDLLLPIVEFAYNSSPHDATEESPFYLLHAMDPHYLSNVIPRDGVTFNHFDADDYKYELLAGTRLAQECATELDGKYKQKMKEAYDKRHKKYPQKTPRVGDRAFLKVPKEKCAQKFPKLCESWGGPYRVMEISENSALLSHINGKDGPIRAPFDSLIALPPQIGNTPLETKTKRVERRQAKVNPVSCSVTVEGNDDNSPLGFFFSLPWTTAWTRR